MTKKITKVPGKWEVGAKVEANYGSKGEYFKGEITKVHAGIGLLKYYDLLYDDGDIEVTTVKSSRAILDPLVNTPPRPPPPS